MTKEQTKKSLYARINEEAKKMLKVEAALEGMTQEDFAGLLIEEGLEKRKLGKQKSKN